MDDLTTIAAGLQALAAQNKPAKPFAGTENILFVDDESLILDMSKEALEDLGYTVKGALNAAEAIQIMVEGFKPEIMCCDIVLPGGMNGVELARKVHEVLPTVKVLLVSGYGAGALNGAVSQDGFQLLSKPYTFDELAQRVRHVLDGRV